VSHIIVLVSIKKFTSTKLNVFENLAPHEISEPSLEVGSDFSTKQIRIVNVDIADGKK
jgi:hypothetical protein